MMGRLSAVVYTCFSMTQKRIGNSVDCFCFSFYSGLLVSSIGFFVLFGVWFGVFLGYVYLFLFFHAFSFSLFPLPCYCKG